MTRRTHTNKISTLRITVIIILLVAGFALYDFLFLNNAHADNSSSTQSLVDPEMAVINQLDSIKLDTTLFDDPAFTSLQDDTIQVPSQPVGNPNPFAPIGGISIKSPTPNPTTSKTTPKTTSKTATTH